MKIVRTLIALSFISVIGVAGCKSSDTPPPETTPATQPAGDETMPPAEGGDMGQPMEGEAAPEAQPE